jgi:hypothetical protein
MILFIPGYIRILAEMHLHFNDQLVAKSTKRAHEITFKCTKVPAFTIFDLILLACIAV